MLINSNGSNKHMVNFRRDLLVHGSLHAASARSAKLNVSSSLYKAVPINSQKFSKSPFSIWLFTGVPTSNQGYDVDGILHQMYQNAKACQGED